MMVWGTGLSGLHQDCVANALSVQKHPMSSVRSVMWACSSVKIRIVFAPFTLLREKNCRLWSAVLWILLAGCNSALCCFKTFLDCLYKHAGLVFLSIVVFYLSLCFIYYQKSFPTLIDWLIAGWLSHCYYNIMQTLYSLLSVGIMS